MNDERQGHAQALSGFVRRVAAVMIAVCLGLAAVPEASALTSYGNLVGTSFTFANMEEDTLTAGDPDPIWGAPSLVGDSLLFTPANYTSNATGGSSDTTEGVFRLDIVSNDKTMNEISQLDIVELGDYSLTGQGSALTNAMAQGAITVTVTEVNLGGVLTATSIGLSDMDTVSFDTPAQGGDWTIGLNADITTALSVFYGPLAVFATEVSVVWNNDLATQSESGTTAQIQKKLGLPAVTLRVIPEPGTAILMGLGLGWLGRRRHSARV